MYAENNSAENSWLVIVNDNQLAAGFVRFHYAMGLTDLVKSKDARRLRLETACSHVLGDLLERDVGKWEARSAENEAAEESQARSDRPPQVWPFGKKLTWTGTLESQARSARGSVLNR